MIKVGKELDESSQDEYMEDLCDSLFGSGAKEATNCSVDRNFKIARRLNYNRIVREDGCVPMQYYNSAMSG